MSRSKSEKNGNGNKCELSIWTRAITANSEWPDKVNITSLLNNSCLTRHSNLNAYSYLLSLFVVDVGRISRRCLLG